MRKIILMAGVFFLFYLSSSAQNLSLIKNGVSVSDGDTLNITGDTSYTNTVSEVIYCKNTSSGTLGVKVRKKELSIVPGSQNTFCWVLCYPNSVMVSPDTIFIPAGDTCKSFKGDYKPRGHMGISYIRYRFFVESDTTDSISVVVKYDCSLSAIGEIAADRIEFANAYPNPADNHVFFNYSIPPSTKDCRLILRDMLGNLVSDLPINEKTGTSKVLTEDLNNGVYFYSLLINDKAYLTRKLIIRHQ
jgi:hypothetical protein